MGTACVGLVIIVVEGPSAAGKTIWATANAGASLVRERPVTPATGDADATARFWADHGVRRWREALDTEARTGLAVCDTDPLNLCYAWSLWRIGQADEVSFQRQASGYRERVAAGAIGFADRYLITLPSVDVLAQRRDADRTRGRRNFDIHVRLIEPIREWYGILDALRPGCVEWSLPSTLPEATSLASRRVDLPLFDVLVEAAIRLARSPGA